MIKIKEIKEAEKSSRFNIFTEEGFAFSLSAKGIYENGVAIGKEYTEEEYEELLKVVEAEKVFSAAVRLLGYRDYSEKELISRLAQKGMDGTEAVSKLVEMGYINDEKYAESIIGKYLSSYGKRRIEEELKKRKIDRQVWEPLLSETCCDLSSAAYEVLCKKQKMNPFADRKEKEKVYAFLVRKGYSHDEIKSALYQYEQIFGEK